MRPFLLLLPALALTACATPREQCINNVSQEAGVISGLITETQGNIARGYALEEIQQVRIVEGTCEGTDSGGNPVYFTCQQQETFTTTQPVAIDLDAEAAKLQSLRTRMTRLLAERDDAIARCVAIYPE